MIFWLECLEFSPEIHYNSLNSFGEREYIMKFYSYDYVLSLISQQIWVSIGISGLLILLTGFFAVKAYRDKHDSKFRELSIISI